MKIQLSEHFTYRKLIKFTIPTIIMMIVTSIYGVVDGLFISNCVGSEAFAGVNLIWPVIMILGAIGFMIGAGGSALVSKTMGEGETKKANDYFSMLIYVLILAGFVLSILGLIFLRPVSMLLGAKGNLVDICVTYGSVLLIALVAFLLQNCFQSFLIVAEKPKMGLIVSILAGLTNMVLDFLLVYVFQMGVLGAAVATGLSQLVGAVIPLLYFRWNRDTKLHLTKTKLELKPILKACANGSSEMVTNISISLVSMLYNLQLMKYAGSNGVVAYGIIAYVGFVFSGTYFGYAVGSAPIIGYHYGAENKEELKSLFKKSIRLIMLTSVVMTLAAELLAKPLATIFVSYDSQLVQMTTNAIRIFAISYLISGINIFASSFFTALNNGLVSAILSFLRTFLFQVAMIAILPAIWGLHGIWMAVVLAEALAIVVSIFFFMAKAKQYEYI